LWGIGELVGRIKKFNTMEVLDKFKIHKKRKAIMNILLCWMVVMPIIHPTLNINVTKMKQAFQMGYRDGDNAFSLEEKHVVYNQLFVIKTIICNYNRHKW